MLKKLSVNPVLYKEILAIRPMGIYRYQQSKRYKNVRIIPAIMWALWWAIVGPLILHIQPYSSIYSVTLPMLVAVLLSILIDYIFYKADKASK